MFLQNPIHVGMFCLYFDLSPGVSKFLFFFFFADWLFKSVFNLHILVDFPTFPSTIDFSFHYIVTGKSSFV